MSASSEIDTPKPTRADLVHSAIKAGLSAIPVAGGPAVELFSQLIVPPIERRRDAWMNTIADRLRSLEEEGKIDFAALQGDESFVTVVMQTTQVALRNHQAEKLDALRNAVLNAAVEESPDDSLRGMFIVFIDTLTVWHIRILKFLDDPAGWVREHDVHLGGLSMGGIGTVIEKAFPELKGQRSFYDVIARELYLRSLTTCEHLHTTMSISGILGSHTSQLGKTFLAFITEPGKPEA
jgi:hypothetical protein